MRIDDFSAHVAAHAGISTDRAAQAGVTVLKSIGSHLSRPARELVAEELPPPLGKAVLAGDETVATPIEERVIVPGETAGEGREIVTSVCCVLAEELSTEAVAAIGSSLPPGYGSLFVTPEAEASTPAVGERDDTLATGRPGSRHAIADARADRTQTDSIAAGNPHAATKLSSSTGTTQERQGETLAEGHQEDVDRTLSGSHR
ncbi:MAG: hypothetical protein HOV81_25600 [Kofleriaceae bacterium]|nr:hypothetical protein [Kofleriaceae bacterium]